MFISMRPPSRQRLQLQVGAAFKAVEPMIGWIDPRSCRVLLVETDDASQVSGWLRDRAGALVLQLEITQSGPGAVVVIGDFRHMARASRPGPGTR